MQTLEAWHLQESRRLHLLLVGMLRSETYAHIRALGYGSFGSMAEGFLEGFEHAIAANPDQGPRLVAGAIVELVEGEPGQRPFRTVVDRMGMGAAVEPLNEQQAQITEGLFRNFGLGHLLNTVVSGNL